MYTQDWTSKNIPLWEEFLPSYKDKPDVHLLEIGVWEGRSALWFLENILTGDGATYTGIDLNESENLKKNFASSSYKDRMTFIQGHSNQILKSEFKDRSFDIIYVDGDHRSYGVVEDAILAWPLLKVGGVMIFDDYKLGEYMNVPSYEDAKYGIDFFLHANRNEVEVLHRGEQVIIQKEKLRNNYYYHKVGKNLFLNHSVYGDENIEEKLVKFVGNQEVEIETSKEDLSVIKEMLKGIPKGSVYFPKSFLDNEDYRKLIEKYKFTVSKFV